jgi:hypothetical protein
MRHEDVILKQHKAISLLAQRRELPEEIVYAIEAMLGMQE